MKSSHTRRSLSVVFDEPGLVANAGLQLTAELAARLELRELFAKHVDLGDRPGRARAGDKAMTAINSLLAGGEWIDDADLLRAGSSQAVLGHRALAASTLGTFLRSFSWGHTKQLDKVSEAALQRAWRLGAGPGSEAVTIDLDSTFCETYGLGKEGTKQVNYTRLHGYHPLLAVIAGSGEVVHSRLRGGNANSPRGAAGFVAETLNRVRRAGARGELRLRGDSGFYTYEVIQACRRHNARFSITVRLYANIAKRIAAIPETTWIAIRDWQGGLAEVAEVPYLAFANINPRKAQAPRPKPVQTRLIVRRVLPAGDQLHLPGLGYYYQAFVTDCEGEPLELEAEHRRHAMVENVIRDLKYGMGLNHMPSGRFAANAAWLAFNVFAHNLLRWLGQLGLRMALTAKSVRQRFLSVPGRLVRSGRRSRLRLPQAWPWRLQFLQALDRLRAAPARC